MLHTHIARFDVMTTIAFFFGIWLGTKQAQHAPPPPISYSNQQTTMRKLLETLFLSTIPTPLSYRLPSGCHAPPCLHHRASRPGDCDWPITPRQLRHPHLCSASARSFPAPACRLQPSPHEPPPPGAKLEHNGGGCTILDLF